MHPPRLAPLPSPQEAGFPWKEPLRFSLPNLSNIDLTNIDLTAGVNAVVSPRWACSSSALPAFATKRPCSSALWRAVRAAKPALSSAKRFGCPSLLLNRLAAPRRWLTILLRRPA